MLRHTLLLLSLFAQPVLAGPVLTVSDAYSFAAPKNARTAAGYLTLTNTGDEPAILVGVEADFPRVMLHDTEIKDDVARMFHVEKFEIPAGGELKLEPGSGHIMFMGLDGEPIEDGEEIPVRLIFDTHDPLDVQLDVRTRETGHGHGHGGNH